MAELQEALEALLLAIAGAAFARHGTAERRIGRLYIRYNITQAAANRTIVASDARITAAAVIA
ncbi:MAG: hypothetical protein P8169_10960 [Chloroflexota bacterium]